MTPTILLPWQHPWLQSLSVKNQISPFATFLSGTGGLPRNRHGVHIVLTLSIRLLGVDDPRVRWNLGILVAIKTGTAAWLLSWQQHDSCHFVSFVMYISGAKFEDHFLNISGDILNSVFYRFSGTIYDVITSLICIIQKPEYPLKEKRYSKKENTILVYFEKPSKQAVIIFYFIGTLNVAKVFEGKFRQVIKNRTTSLSVCTVWLCGRNEI